jgi:hypothetical protein
MVVFVDEAGDTGLKRGQGSTQFFIITVVLFDQDDEAAASDQRITQLRHERRLAPDFELHFNETPRYLKKLLRQRRER